VEDRPVSRAWRCAGPCRLSTTHDDLRRMIDEIHLQDLRDKREAARGSNVALDDLHLVALRDELNVEWTVQLECSCDLLCNPPDPAHRLEVGSLRREDERRVPGVDASVFDMFADGPELQFTTAGDAVHLELSRVLDELAHHDWILLRDPLRLLQELDE